MKRQYQSGTADDVMFFTGQEVEYTPAHNLKTLFVVGLHEISAVEHKLDYSIEHIYFGANHSCDPKSPEEWLEWDNLVGHFLKKGIWVTLEFDVNHVESMLESGFTEHNNFIPLISVKMPYIWQLGYNAVVKIDDKDYNKSNPGVWCHMLHDLQDRNKFTDWTKYAKDKVI